MNSENDQNISMYSNRFQVERKERENNIKKVRNEVSEAKKK